MNFSERIAAVFVQCCSDELEIPKPGNVHALSVPGRKTPQDFERSAEAAARPLTASGAPVGRRIFGAVEASRAAVPHNTNLGIILLCAPLAAAAEQQNLDLRTALAAVLRTLDVADAELAFRAIVMATPGGLGRAQRHDVFEPAQTSLRAAMAEAADRDRVARQYATDFEDVFALGEPLLATVLAVAAAAKWAFWPSRNLPLNRVRHTRIRVRLRLHPGRGFASAFECWLRWGRLASFWGSKRARPSLPFWYRLTRPAEHSVFAGRAHYGSRKSRDQRIQPRRGCRDRECRDFRNAADPQQKQQNSGEHRHVHSGDDQRVKCSCTAEIFGPDFFHF